MSGRYPNTYRLGMFMALQKVTARWAKSLHTPLRAAKTSAAVVSGLLEPYWKARFWWTQSEIACTRAQPAAVWPKSSQAVSISS